MTSSLILFGATGDLAQRMLLPSLYGLDAEGLLPDGLQIVSTARSDLDDAGYRELSAAALTRFVDPGSLRPAHVAKLLGRTRFVPVDARQTSQFSTLAETLEPGDGDHAIFLSTAPSLCGATISGLAGAGLATAADIMRGLDVGLTHFKFFPATASGGIPALKALVAPFSQCRFCPTGGITFETASDWLALDPVICVGGTWVLPPDMDRLEIERRSRAAANLPRT